MSAEKVRPEPGPDETAAAIKDLSDQIKEAIEEGKKTANEIFFEQAEEAIKDLAVRARDALASLKDHVVVTTGKADEEGFRYNERGEVYCTGANKLLLDAIVQAGFVPEIRTDANKNAFLYLLFPPDSNKNGQARPK